MPERAADEAAALGLAPEEVAKTLVLATPEGNLRAVLPASERIDLRKVGELVGVSGKKAQLASEDDLARDYEEFELGAVPPFGGKADRVIVDRRLAERGAIVLEAGSHERSLRVQAAELVRLTGRTWPTSAATSLSRPLTLALLDPRDARRGREDARVPVLPAHLIAGRLLLEHGFDDTPASRRVDPLRLDDDRVSHPSLHGTESSALDQFPSR